MACIQRGESVIRYTMLSARAKGKADLALIAQGRKVMKRPEGNTKDLKITLVIWSKSADKHLMDNPEIYIIRGSNLRSLGC